MSVSPLPYKPTLRRRRTFVSPRVLKGFLRTVKVFVVWIVVAVIVGIAVVTVRPPQNPNLGVAWLSVSGLPARITFGCGLVWRGATGRVGVGIGLAWWNLPGTILGLATGIYLSRKSWLDFFDRPPQ